MSQKSTDNSNLKRRAPSDTVESDKHDADWGFAPDDADPAIEKKLAVALVVCLLAGFGFVFYQKFRLLRNDDVQQAGTPELSQPGENSGSGDPGSEDITTALQAATPDASIPSDVSPAGTQVESPFYEQEQADSSPSDSDATWTLTQAEVTHQSAPPSPPADLPPLPERTHADAADPFAGQDADDAEDTRLSSSEVQQAAPDEPPMLVWQDETALPSASAQSNPPPDTLPQIAPQSSPSPSATQADPFAFDDEPGTPRGDLDSGTSPATDPHRDDEPPLLMFGGEPEPSQQNASDETSPAPKSETVPAQSEPATFEELNAIDQAMPLAPEASQFDPFADTTPLDEPATAAPADSSSAASSASSPASTGDAESEEMFVPFPTSDPPSPGQTERSMDIAIEPEGDLDPADDPFSFPQSNSGPPAQIPPLDSEPALEPFPAVEKPAPPESAATPTWPSRGSSRVPETLESPAPFPSPEAVGNTAPRQSDPPQPIIIEPSEVKPTTPFPEPTDSSSSTVPPNPFSIDAGTPRPAINSIQDAQRVVGERELTVTPSDTFWSISEREYGSSRYFTALARYNSDRVSKPEQLQSGMKIIIPPPEVLEDRFPELFRRTAQEASIISPMSGTSSAAPAEPGLFLDQLQRPFFRVGEKDTLSSIARQHLGRESRWTEIYDLNKDSLKSPSSLTIGMELKLPPDASGVRVSPAGGFDR